MVRACKAAQNEQLMVRLHGSEGLVAFVIPTSYVVSKFQSCATLFRKLEIGVVWNIF
jgi:hypothetical protein